MKAYIQKIVEGKDLTKEESRLAISEIFSDSTDAQLGAFLIGLKMKGETVDEISGFAMGMKEAARTISPNATPIVDTCGTGGDKYNTINVSTAAAIVTASLGVSVAKHGNYAMTSKCGSADVLCELGVKIDMEPDQVKSMIEKVGIGFMLAPVFHPSMKRVVLPRREIGVRTVFNILGPLTNPAGAKAQVIGVFDEAMCEKLANVLGELGAKRALVVHGSGMDEISNAGKTKVAELKDGNVSTYEILPNDLGYKMSAPEDIFGGSVEENARDIVEIFNGKKGPKRDIVCMNSGASIYVSGSAETIKEGAKMAEDAMDQKKSLEKLKEMVNYSGDLKKLERYL